MVFLHQPCYMLTLWLEVAIEHSFLQDYIHIYVCVYMYMYICIYVYYVCLTSVGIWVLCLSRVTSNKLYLVRRDSWSICFIQQSNYSRLIKIKFFRRWNYPSEWYTIFQLGFLSPLTHSNSQILPPAILIIVKKHTF